MDIRDRRELKQEAGRILSESACDHKKLILIHTGVSSVLLLALTVVDFLLEQGIGQTGGLGGVGMRTVLSTAQSVLQLAATFALPFWELGYIFAILRISRSQSAAAGTLLEGFRHFGPSLRFQLLKSLLFVGIALFLFYPITLFLLSTPLGVPLMEVLEPVILEATQTGAEAITLDGPVLEAAMDAMLPMMLVFIAIYLLACAPLYYRLRMGEFALMDAPKKGAIFALLTSARGMRGKCKNLFRLDLSFWWFYALEAFLGIVCYADVLLPMVGIQLPFSATAAFFLFYVLNLVGQVALNWWKRNEVMCTYALVYEGLSVSQEETLPAEQPKPWDYE